MPVFLGIASQPSSILSEAAGAFVPASAPAIAASIAVTLARAATISRARPKNPKSSKKPKSTAAPEDILHWGRRILPLEPCWLRLPDSPEDFAHICLITQDGYGRQTGRSKLLICDSETYEEIWVQKNATALYPFRTGAISDPDFTAKFSMRPGHLDTQAFQEALKLAYMCSDESNVNHGDALKLLMLGYLGRRHIVTKKSYFTSCKQLCEEARMQQNSCRATENLSTEANAQTLNEVIRSKKPQMKGAMSGTQTKNRKNTTALKMKSMTRKQLSKKSGIKNRVAKKGANSSLTKPIMKFSGKKRVVQKRKIKPPTNSESIKSRKISTAGSLSDRKAKTPQERLPQHQKGDLISSMKKKRAPTSAVSSFTQKRSSVNAKSKSFVPEPAVGHSPNPKGSRKKQKLNGNEIDAQLPLSCIRKEALPSIESQPQNFQTAPPKLKIIGQGLCQHNVKPYNCPKCIKNNFTSWKLRESDDALDNNL